jgi:hypothetical protein
LRNTNIKVFELAPPLTQTPLSKGDFGADDLGGVKAMDVKALAKHAIDGIKNDRPRNPAGLKQHAQDCEPVRAELYAQATQQVRRPHASAAEGLILDEEERWRSSPFVRWLPPKPRAAPQWLSQLRLAKAA